MKYSISPSGEYFKLPDKKTTENEIKRILSIIQNKKKEGKKIIVVQGLGFVGAINAAVIADTIKNSKSLYFVIGIDLPTSNSFWKIEMINRGECPFKSEDNEVENVYRRTVIEKKNFLATWITEAYSYADILLIDINLDVIKHEIGNAKNSTISIEPFKKAMFTIGMKIKPDCLILVETTVPPGTTEKIIKPIIQKCFISRKINMKNNPPLIAHSYERIMPGKNYVNSIRNIWRTYSGLNKKSEEKARLFLETIGNVKDFPLWRLDKPTSSELAKIIENSYRALNIAFIYEWTLFAEDMGVNLFEVIHSIKVRKGTHDNMMFPGFGVGGYCLTKDPLLAHWSSKKLFKRKKELNFSIEAININDLMPLHTFEIIKEGLNNNIHGKKISIMGASYRRDVDDPRNSPTILLYDRLMAEGANVVVHDPYVKTINQRKDINVISDILKAIKSCDVIVFVVNHQQYIDLSPSKIISNTKKPRLVVDAVDILSDKKIKELKSKSVIVKGVGKGHISRL